MPTANQYRAFSPLLEAYLALEAIMLGLEDGDSSTQNVLCRAMDILWNNLTRDDCEFLAVR